MSCDADEYKWEKLAMAVAQASRVLNAEKNRLKRERKKRRKK